MSRELKYYRVVFNGINYRVQALIKRWWRLSPKWVFCGKSHPDCGFVISDFNTLADAEGAITTMRKYDEADKKGYQPILGSGTTK